MNGRKNVLIVCFVLMQALVLFAQSPKEFVCRVVPSENDKAYQMLKSAEIRFREYNYKDQAEDIKAFLAKVVEASLLLMGAGRGEGREG